jgi:hypothetical protein
MTDIWQAQSRLVIALAGDHLVKVIVRKIDGPYVEHGAIGGLWITPVA